VEANPLLVEKAHAEFATEIADGRLRIFGVAIAEQAGTAQLAVADSVTEWSSLFPGFIAGNENSRATRYRTVETGTSSYRLAHARNARRTTPPKTVGLRRTITPGPLQVDIATLTSSRSNSAMLARTPMTVVPLRWMSRSSMTRNS
jgi:hypothetical protein